MAKFDPQLTFADPNFSTRSKGQIPHRELGQAIGAAGQLGQNLVNAHETQTNNAIEGELRQAKHDLFASEGLGDLYDPNERGPIGYAKSERDAKILSDRMKQQTIDPGEFHLKAATLAQGVRSKWGPKWADKLISKYFGDPANQVVQDMITQSNSAKGAQERQLAADKRYVISEQNQMRIWSDLRSAPFRQPGNEDWTALRAIGTQLAGEAGARNREQELLEQDTKALSKSVIDQKMANDTTLLKSVRTVMIQQGFNNPAIKKVIDEALEDGRIEGNEIELVNGIFQGLENNIRAVFLNVAQEDSFRVDEAGEQISRAGLQGLVSYRQSEEAALADLFALRDSILSPDEKHPFSLLNRASTLLKNAEEIDKQDFFRDVPYARKVKMMNEMLGDPAFNQMLMTERPDGKSLLLKANELTWAYMTGNMIAPAKPPPGESRTSLTMGEQIVGSATGDSTDSPEVVSKRAKDTLQILGRALAGEELHGNQDNVDLLTRMFVDNNAGEFLSHFKGESKRLALSAITNPAVSKYIFETVVKDNPELAEAYKNFAISSFTYVPEFKMSVVDLNTAMSQTEGRVEFSVNPNTLQWSTDLNYDVLGGTQTQASVEAEFGLIKERVDKILDKINPYFALLNGMKDATKQDPQKFLEDVFETYRLEVPKSQQKNSPTWEVLGSLFDSGDVNLAEGERSSSSTSNAKDPIGDFINQSEDKVLLANYIQQTAVDTPLEGLNEESYQEIADFVVAQEGYITKAKWDVNAYRAGFGSDTTTLPDGTVVPITQGMSVNRADSERDLARRLTKEFGPRAKKTIGADAWDSLTPEARVAISSITYNYGKVPSTVKKQAKSGDLEALAKAVESLPGAANKARRKREAELIRSSNTIG